MPYRWTPDPIDAQPVKLTSRGSRIHRSHYRIWIHIVGDEIVGDEIVGDERSVLRSMTALLIELGCMVTSTSTTNSTSIYMQSNTPDASFVDYRLQGNDSGLKKHSALLIPAFLAPIL